MAEEYQSQFRELLDENEIPINSLPVELKKQANIVVNNIKKYNENQDQEFKKKLVTQDTFLAEKIQDWLEKDIEGEYIEDVEAREQEKINNIYASKGNDGKIHQKKLAEILGRNPNQTEKIGNVTCKKGFLSEYWNVTVKE